MLLTFECGNKLLLSMKSHYILDKPVESSAIMPGSVPFLIYEDTDAEKPAPNITIMTEDQENKCPPYVRCLASALTLPDTL